MSYHSFFPEYRYSAYRWGNKEYTDRFGKHIFDPIRNHPHYSGAGGPMAQPYFYWYEGEPDGLVAREGYYFLNGDKRWWGLGCGNGQRMHCWQFHWDDHREYVDWEWWSLRESWKDNRGCIHYRKRFEGKGTKPQLPKVDCFPSFELNNTNEYGETFPIIQTFVKG